MENYIELKTLGKGGNGCVVKVKSLDSNEVLLLNRMYSYLQ